MSSAIEQYQKISLQTAIEDINAYKVIQTLMDNALAKIAKAAIFMQANKIAEKGLHIGFAITTIDALQASLDLDKGGEIARNLSDLYHYMVDKLVMANLTNDLTLLEEITKLLTTIKSGWDGIEQEAMEILTNKKV